MCKENCGCKKSNCFPDNKCNECKIRTPSDCITVPVDLPNIGSEEGEVLTTVLEMIDEQLAITPPVPTISITNVGEGEEIFKELSNLGNYEFRTILGTGDVEVTQNGDTLEINVDIPTPITPTTYSVNNLGTGAEIYSGATTSPTNTQFNLKSIQSSTLSITQTEEVINIDTPETAMVPALYVNNQYVPSYSEFLSGNTKGQGTFAKPFTDTVVYTSPTTFTQTPNTSIQNALDAYVGTGTRLNPEKVGQRIVIQNNSSSYTFEGDFNYTSINLTIEGTVFSTTSGYLINMDNPSFFNATSSSATININEGTLSVNGLGFINSGNNITTNTLLTGRQLIVNSSGEGSILSTYNGADVLTRYLFNSDPNGTINGTIGANNDGTLPLIINSNITSVYQGILKIGGKSRVHIRDKNIVSGSPITAVNSSLVAFNFSGGDIAMFSTSCYLYGTRQIGFNFQTVNGFTPTFNLLKGTFEGYANTWFNKSDNTTVPFSITNTTTQFFSGVQLFNTPNLWSINFRDNIFQNISVDFTKVDFTQGNVVSSINTIGNNVIETLTKHPNRVSAQAVLPPYSAFVNTADNVITALSTSADWFRDITLPTI